MECQVEKNKLKNPVCVKTIYKNKVDGEDGTKQAEEQLTNYLDNLGIRFAVEREDSITEIFVEADSLEE